MEEAALVVGLVAACDALSVTRSTFYRNRSFMGAIQAHVDVSA